MFRALLYLLTTVIVITVVKSVIGIFAKAFSTAAQQQPPPRPPGQTRQAPQTLKKDPVCGTFVAASTEFQKTKGGTTYYFCSPACRDKF